MMQAHAPIPPSHSGEVKVSGIESCRALFNRRPQDIRRVYLLPWVAGVFADMLTWCRVHNVRYELVEIEPLSRFAETRHHDGICVVAAKKRLVTLAALLAFADKQSTPLALLLVDGVKNPNNIGAITRVCSYFGVPYLLAAGQTLGLTLAAMRTSQGGAENVDLVPVGDGREAVTALKQRGWATLLATSHGSARVSDAPLATKVIFLFGGENAGVSPPLAALADGEIAIPGSGNIESLNVACATSVLLWEHWRQHRLAESRPPPPSTSRPRPQAGPPPRRRRRRRGSRNRQPSRTA